MSEMIERVAKAIFDCANGLGGGGGEYVGDYRAQHGKYTTLDGIFDLEAFARAAIEAMREPEEVSPERADGVPLPVLLEAVRLIREWEDSDDLARDLAVRLYELYRPSLQASETSGS